MSELYKVFPCADVKLPFYSNTYTKSTSVFVLLKANTRYVMYLHCTLYKQFRMAFTPDAKTKYCKKLKVSKYSRSRHWVTNKQSDSVGILRVGAGGRWGGVEGGGVRGG